jgi:hypothetical protein
MENWIRDIISVSNSFTIKAEPLFLQNMRQILLMYMLTVNMHMGIMIANFSSFYWKLFYEILCFVILDMMY